MSNLLNIHTIHLKFKKFLTTKHRMTISFICILLLITSTQIAGKPKIMLEVVGNTQTRQLYIKGFEKLDRNDRILAYYLTRAGWAGRDIYYDQNYIRALMMRDLFENLVIVSKYFEPDIRNNIRTYMHRFWINSCQYDHFSKRKFVPDFSADQLIYEMQNNVKIPKALNIDTIIDQINLLSSDIFDSTYFPIHTIKKANPDLDILKNSANNLYENVSIEDINAWLETESERYPANSKLIKRNGIIEELVYRAGDQEKGITAGLYSDELSHVIYYLNKAKSCCSDEQKLMIENLIQFYKTGETRFMNQSFIHWLRNDSNVDFLQGFIEVYLDALGKKGSFQSLVYFKDINRTDLMRQLINYAPYLEQKAPYPDEFKRIDFTVKPEVQAVLLISGAGDGGPIPPAGLNLPNDQKFGEMYGYKNLVFTNVMGISGGNDFVGNKKYIRRFVYDFFHPNDIKELKKVSENANFAMVCLHELIGHGSGRLSDTLSMRPQIKLKEYYATIEEARAELMALWSIHDPVLQQIGLIDSENSADEIFRQWARYFLLKLSHMENRTTIEEDHERARHMIMNYIYTNSKALSINKIKDELFIKVKSISEFKKAVGELLTKITIIKSTANYSAAQKMIETYGIYINTTWRDHMVRRFKKIRADRPDIKSFGFSMPLLIPEYDKHDQVVNVTVKYLRDFEKEQLFYSKKIEIH